MPLDEILGLSNPAPLSLTALTVNMLLGGALGSVVAWFYARYGRSLSNRAKFAQTLPVLALITVLIISVVKSSLALSLGLVGALSIVRFRTAIKEPEELVYLFMAIAIGLGLGADQRLPTLLAILLVLSFLGLRHLIFSRPPKNNLYFNIATSEPDSSFTQINTLLQRHLSQIEMRRLDHNAQGLQATYLIHCPDDTALAALLDQLREQFPTGEFTFIEQDNSLAG